MTRSTLDVRRRVYLGRPRRRRVRPVNALLLLLVVAVVAMLVATVRTANAHTPSTSRTCTTVTVSLTNYPRGSHVTITGVTPPVDRGFSPNYSGTWTVSYATTVHITVTSPDHVGQINRDIPAPSGCAPTTTTTKPTTTTTKATTTTAPSTTTTTEATTSTTHATTTLPSSTTTTRPTTSSTSTVTSTTSVCAETTPNCSTTTTVEVCAVDEQPACTPPTEVNPTTTAPFAVVKGITQDAPAADLPVTGFPIATAIVVAVALAGVGVLTLVIRRRSVR